MTEAEAERYAAYHEETHYRKSNFMLWMVIGYLFLFVFRPYEYWQVLGTLRVERIYMIFLLIMVMFNRQKRYISNKINKTVICFFLTIIIASIFAFKPSEAYPVTFDYFKLIIFYFVIIMTIRDSEDLKIFVLAYLLIMLMYSGKSAWEFFLHGRFTWAMGIKRMVGIDLTYSDPNSFAASIAYSLPFLWGMIKYRLERRFLRLLLWCYGGLAIVCIIYSGSRSGMVTALFLVFLIWLNSRKKVWGILLLPVLFVGIWFAMPESYKIRFKSTFFEGVASEVGQKGADESAKGRIAGLKAGFRTMLIHPAFGIGPGNFKYAWRDDSGEYFGMSAHNLYGQILGELGLAGTLTFAIFIAITFKTHRNLIIFLTEKQKNLKNTVDNLDNRVIIFYITISTASLQTLLLLLFNGNFGHNLYRYNYLWVGAMAVLINYFVRGSKKLTEYSNND